jgi:hypothetical protein
MLMNDFRDKDPVQVMYPHAVLLRAPLWRSCVT